MKKISVMIVDDEKLVLEDLKTLVDWEALGFEIVATAFNGKQGWAGTDQKAPGDGTGSVHISTDSI